MVSVVASRSSLAASTVKCGGSVGEYEQVARSRLEDRSEVEGTGIEFALGPAVTSWFDLPAGLAALAVRRVARS